MASSGKKKGKKGKTLSLTTFLAGDAGSGGGGGSAPAPAYQPPPKSNWADEMDNQDFDDSDYGYGSKPSINRSLLPTAPRAARGPDIDMANVPSQPPFKAYLGNLPYDITPEDIERFFGKLRVVNVSLPQDQGRQKGFGYAEFEDRNSLIDALSMNDESLRNRKIRIDLAQTSDRDRDRGGGFGGGRRDNFDDDRTSGDWRKKDDRPSAFEDRRDDRGSFGRRDRFDDRDRDRYDRYSNGPPDYRDQRSGYGQRDRNVDDRGYRSYRDGYRDRDRGFSRGGDRDGFSRGGDRDGFSRGGDRDGFSRGGDRDGFSRGGDRDGFSRGGDRDGFSRGGDRDGGRRTFGTGFNRDNRDDRYQPPRDRGFDRGPRDDRGGSQDDRGYRDDRGDDRGPRRDDFERGPREDSHDGPKERPRLNLTKRSKPIEEAGKPAERSTSIFGSAKPVDTAAREREIEEKLRYQKERDKRDEAEKENRESRMNSSTSQRPRRESSGSQDGENRRRERKLSSSSSGKGIRTVAPPPGVGSARVRRDSALSDDEDVFSEDKDRHSGSPSTNQTPPKPREDTKLVPAPPPKENIWEKRKTGGSGGSGPTSPPPSGPEGGKDAVSPPKGDSPATRSDQEALSPKSKEFVPAAPPKENPWEKRKLERKDDDSGPNDRAWGSSAPRGRGGAVRGGRGHDAPRGGGGGRGAEKPHKKAERPLPKSVDEMPKYEEKEAKDFSDANKFSFLMEEGEEDQ